MIVNGLVSRCSRTLLNRRPQSSAKPKDSRCDPDDDPDDDESRIVLPKPHIPQTKLDDKPVERLLKLGSKRDRSVNYLVVEAILQYLDREEKR